MISIFLRDLRPRLLLVAVAAWLLYLLEPGFHTHGAVSPEDSADLGPLGLAATLAYLSGISVIVLLSGFVSTDRRRGYAQLFFSHPVRPLAFYALRWSVAVGAAITVAAIFLVVGQFVAWGGFHGGWSGLLIAGLSALVWGGVMAFLSTALPRGEAWVAMVAFIPTLLPQTLIPLERIFSPSGYRLLLFLLPPQAAFQDVYEWILLGTAAWESAAYAAGYGLFWLVLAGLLLLLREWG
ncbi:MAG: hypothetical protein M3483_01460 [Gemmatimonadota bacterium]|nr:hypothetical protein [Gemmatimonadota bacterium]